MALFFATNHIAYNVAESSAFEQFVDAVRHSDVKLHGRKRLGADLDALAASMRRQVTEQLHSNEHNLRSVALLVDGWTNVKHTKVTNLLLAYSGVAYYWCSINNAYEANTAEYLFRQVHAEMQKLHAAGIIITALVADNESTMNALYRLLRAEYPFLVHVGCAAHTVQLIAKKVMQSERWASVCRGIKALLRGFKKSKAARLKLLEAQLATSSKAPLMLVKPCDTRWNSYLHAAQRLEKLEPKVRSLEDLTFQPEASFWTQLSAFVAFMTPFEGATNVLQSDSATLKDVFQQMGVLCAHTADSPEYVQEIRKRWTRQLNDNATVSCSILAMDMESLLSTVSKETIERARQWLTKFGVDLLLFHKRSTLSAEQLHAKLIIQLGHFNCRRKGFATLDTHIRETKAYCNAMKQQWTPLLVWDFYAVELSDVARALLTMPPSEAAAERSFSAQKLVHTDLRNRLGDASVQNEMFVCFNHRVLSGDRKELMRARAAKVVEMSTDFIDVDTEAETDDDAHWDEDAADSEHSEEDERSSSSEEEKEDVMEEVPGAAAAAAAASPLRSQSEINSDNRSFLSAFIAYMREQLPHLHLQLPWARGVSKEVRLQLEARALADNPGGYSTEQLLQQLKLLLAEEASSA